MKLKIKQYYNKVINNKYVVWVRAGLNILLFAFLLELVTGNSDFGKLTGWIGISIIVLVNIYGIWASRKMIKGFKNYIFYVADEKAKEHREAKKKDET